MVTIIAYDKNGKVVQGSEKKVDITYWNRLKAIDRSGRWKEVKKKEVKSNIKKEENGTKKRSGTGIAVKKA
jgi:hypothetical protein